MRSRTWIGYLAVALVFTGLGLALGRTDVGSRAGNVIAHAGLDAAGRLGGAVAGGMDVDMRSRVLLENPELISALREGGGFGGDFSRAVAQNMFGRTEDAIADARELTRVEEIAPRTWLIRFPIVNAVLFETDAGLVLVDTGMGPAGPALLEAIREVSDAPLHTIVYTHGHVDHAYGTWALIEAGETPEIVAQERILARFERYLRLPGSIAAYMSQPVEQMPRERADIVWPTRTFDERLELEIGGETFILQHHRGETDDQLYVWVPGRRALASADYYQGFLPNAGNGKRVQRHVEEWAFALREMAALEPAILLPAHGEALIDPVEIQDSLGVHAELLEYVVKHTIDGLNAGLRKDQVYQSLELPPHLAHHPKLNVQYVTAKDISKMVIRRYTGWWDDVPSHWSPVPRESEAAALVDAAGGMRAFTARGRELLESDVPLAAHFADWSFLADPSDPDAQRLVLDVYRKRILAPDSNIQEILAYLDAMATARAAQLEASD